MNNTTITIKTDSKIKKQSQELFAELGLDMSTAINMFLCECIKEKGISFISSDMSNTLTLKAINDAKNGNNVNGPFDSFDDMVKDIVSAKA